MAGKESKVGILFLNFMEPHKKVNKAVSVTSGQNTYCELLKQKEHLR